MDPDDQDIIVVPSHFAIGSVILRPKGDDGGRPSLVNANEGDRIPPHGHPSRLLELPTELLLHIFGFLLPRAQIFHFMPTTKSNYRLISIHRIFRKNGIVTTSEEDKQNSLSALSSICRRLTMIAYSVFFGENQFVFEIATAGLTSVVRCIETDLASWNKVIRAELEGLAPLGYIGARYIKHLTLCVSLTCRLPTRHEWRRLEDSILRIAQVFEGSEYDIRSLTVDVGFGRRTRKRVTTNRLEVSSSNGLRMQVRNIGNEAGKEPMARTMDKLVRLIAPVIFMEGVKDLQMSGILTAETMHAYKAELLKHGDRVAGRFEEEPPAKRRKII